MAHGSKDKSLDEGAKMRVTMKQMQNEVQALSEGGAKERELVVDVELVEVRLHVKLLHKVLTKFF
ncbi:hypothetical protein [Adlercreutzia sp. ZJ304]|uniref:hypothetical protein n=1 Tax=Adlercreutzia sp. ZJ304 TaxID=2709791 RepID=UPI0013EA8AC3|nr:hypothetical protein [Adlercreutzia sp. ZJ304]